MSAPDSIVLQAAFTGMAVPLLTVPATAAVLAVLLVPAMRRLRERASVLPDACICVGSPVPADSQGQFHAAQVRLGVSGTGDCPTGVEVATAGAGRALDSAHVISGTAVSFARGLNDTPKIAAIALAGGALGGLEASVLVVAAMALGGLVAGFRVGDTMAYRMTRMDSAEGMAGNLVAAGLVIAATPLGLPVSTTHVTCGALAGVAAGNRSGRWRTLTAIAVAWVVTLPLAAALAAGLWLLLQSPSNS